MKQFSKDLGNVSLAPKGRWSKEQEYERLNLVYNDCDNLSYVAKIDVPIGVEIDNREYWQPMNATGYADNNFINLTAENENGTITAYETLEEAVATILPINRRAGATLSFYNLNSDRLDRQAEFELWQFNSTDLANWEIRDYWNNIYYNWNVFAGWYVGADGLKNHVKIPNVGQYAYVGTNLNDALLYQCRTNGTWTNTGIKVRNYISIVVSGNITIGDNGNWFSNGKDTGIPATPAVDEQLDNIIIQLQQHATEIGELKKQDVVLKNNIDSNFETINNKVDNIKTATDNKIDTADANLQEQITSNDNDIATLNTKHESLSRTVQGIAATGGASTSTNVTYNNDASGLNAENTQDAIDEVSSIGHFAKRGGIVNISTNYNSTNTAEVLTLKQAIAKVPSSDRVLGFQGKFLSEDGWNTYIFNSDSISDWNDVSKWYKDVNNVELNKNFLSSYPFCKTEVNYHIKELYIDKNKLPKEFANYGFLFFGFQKEKNRYIIHFVGTNDNFASYTNLSYMYFDGESLLSNIPLEIIKYDSTKEVLGYIILNDFTTKTPIYKNVELTDYIFKLDINPILFSTINKSLLNDKITKLEEKVIGDSIDLIFGSYIPTDTGTIDLENIISAYNFAYKIIDCKEGDKFLIKGLGGHSPRLFCFIDTNNNTILISPPALLAKNYLVSAPANSVKCIFNFSIDPKLYSSSVSLYKYDNVYNVFKTKYDFTNNIENYYYTENLDLNAKIQELYIQDTYYKYYRFIYFVYQKEKSRFVIQINGSNNPDFTDEKTVVYYTNSNIKNESLITLKNNQSSKGEIAGYIIVRNFTEKDTINLADVKPVLLEKSFNLTQNTHIALAANKVISTLNHPIKTIGALYFDGWSGNSGYRLANEELFPNSTLPNKEGYSDWREYAKAHDPELIKKNHLPPSDCSFSMFYPKQALEEYPSRKPYFGWVINTTEQMEKQIEMAVKYGIDYFVFCFYIGSYDNVFDESGNIKTDALESFPYNNAIYRFLESTNNYKMKFSVLVCDHGNRTNEKTLFQLLKYINEKFASHPSYMYINGRPMICFFDSHFNNKIKAFHQINGSLLLQNGMDIIPKNGINGRMSYGGAIPSNIGLHPYSDIPNYNNNIINKYYVNSPSYMDIPTVSVGRNDFPRADFITKNETNSFGFIEPTKDELLTYFKKIIDTLPKYSRQDQTLLIYAWNEFGEGGYLVPTEGITTTVVNEYPLLDDLGEPILDSSSNPLYCDDYKLQAVKEAKEYWINL